MSIELGQANGCSSGESCCGGRCKGDRLALTVALIMAGVLGFAAFAKLYHPNPKQLALDYSVGAIQIPIVLWLVIRHRCRWTWATMSVLWAAMAGWSAFKSWHGESCGCFAALWEPPPYSTSALGAVFSVMSLGLSARRGSGAPTLLAAFVLAIGAAGTGWMLSDKATPPRIIDTETLHGGKTAAERLLEAPPMADILEQQKTPGGPAWLIFCFDPTCHICEAMKPTVDFMKETWEQQGDPVLQIREFSIPDIERDLKIESYAWMTPTLFIVNEGRITRLWSGKELEDFTAERLQEIHDKVASGEYLQPAPATAPPAPK